jgi:hypothetical protein
LYIHESVMISVEHRKAYLDHFTEVWGPKSRQLYGMRCFGVWATSGSTGAWPEAIVMWELEGLHHLTGMMTGEFDFLKEPVAQSSDHYDQFWSSAPPGVVPTMGFDRLLMSSALSPSIEDLVESGMRGEGYYHETVSVRPGGAIEYLALCERELVPAVQAYGPRFVGGFRTLLRSDDEVVLLWALPTWAEWECFARDVGRDPELEGFREAASALEARAVSKLLVGAAKSPMESGRLL